MPPDLVLLDIMMPQMDGYEVCQHLRQDVRTSEVPIIFLSALDDSQEKAKGFSLGGDDYIAKPFHLEEVLARIKYQIDVKRRQVQLQRRAERYRQASYALREAYRLLQDIFNGLTEGVAVFQGIRDEAGEVIDFSTQITNRAFGTFLPDGDLSLTEADRLEASNNFRASEFKAFNADRTLLDLCFQVINNNAPVTQEFSIVQGDRQRWIEISAAKLRDSIVALLRDISDAKTQIMTLETVRQEFYHLANTDVLTKIANRYRFEVYFEAQWQRSLGGQQPIALILGDIDKFKRFNDLGGHNVGDRCLQAVAQALQTVVKRPTDLVARYGGEEFAILLPNTPLRGAIQIAQAIQTRIRKLRFTNVPSPYCEQVCISLGVSSVIPQLDQSPAELIEAADRALYGAKALGGDIYCVEIL
jgi:diguanylate cyclase (GGDEF)-like protein